MRFRQLLHLIPQKRLLYAIKVFIVLSIFLSVGYIFHRSDVKSHNPSGTIQTLYYEVYKRSLANRDSTAPGENGQAVHLEGDEKIKADKLFKTEAFNIIASDKIAVDRSIPDTRDPQ